MSIFTQAKLEPTGEYRCGRQLFRVADGFQFDIGYVGSGLSVHVPAGFVTDGPSIPAWIAWLLPTRRMVKSSAVHDLLREDRRFSKLEGDAIFLTAMRAEGTPLWLRELAFLAVRINASRKVNPANEPMWK